MVKAIQIAFNEHFELKCKLAQEAGFQGISVNFDCMKQIGTERMWDEAPEKIMGILERYGLKSVQSHVPYYDLRISADELDEKMEYAIKNSIRVSGEIGTPWCVYHPRTAVNDGFKTSKSLEINKRVVSEYLEIASKANTGVALENLPVFRIVPSMPFYSSNYEDLCELSDAFDCDNVGICWDTGHANMMHFDQAEAVKYLGKRIKCTHIHNNIRDEDTHLPPDQGNIDWKKLMEAFKSFDYDGPLTLETHCKYHDVDLLRSFAKHNFECLKFLEKFFDDAPLEQ